MRIKRFRARDVTAAVRMVKDELGPEAVILSTRELDGRNEGGAGVEITAGVSYHPETAAVSRVQSHTKGPGKDVPVSVPAPALDTTLKGLEDGLVELKDLLLDLTHRSAMSERLRDRVDLVRLYRELLDADLDPVLARALVEKAADGNGQGGDLRKTLTSKLSALLKTGPRVSSSAGKAPRHIALIGPSGVGKTTTLAKLAAFWSKKEKKKTALISLDTYRLGAAEQLKTYARIMGLPLRVAQDKEEFRQALELFETMEVILIDTAGRCLSRPEFFEELRGLINEVKGLKVMLVLSAVTKDRDLTAAIKQSEPLPVESLIISKIDETTTYGNVINNLLKCKKPVSFLTNGQKVPDDLVPATPNLLAELITAGSQERRHEGKSRGHK